MSTTTEQPTHDVARRASQAELVLVERELMILENIIAHMASEREPLVIKVSPDSFVASESLKRYCSKIDEHKKLQEHFKQLKKYRVELQLKTLDPNPLHLRFSDIQDWAEFNLNRHKESLNAISVVAVFGAGISFTTIFSASRGSIVLISWAWTAFTVSFCTCVYLQIMQRTDAVGRQQYIDSRRWRTMLKFYIGTAFASLYIGIVLVNVAILQLGIRRDNLSIDTHIKILPAGVVALAFVAFAIPYTFYLYLGPVVYTVLHRLVFRFVPLVYLESHGQFPKYDLRPASPNQELPGGKYFSWHSTGTN